MQRSWIVTETFVLFLPLSGLCRGCLEGNTLHPSWRWQSETGDRRRRGRQEDTCSDNEGQCSVVRRALLEHGVLSRYGLVFTVTDTSLKIDVLYIGRTPTPPLYLLSTLFHLPAYCRYIGHTLVLRKNHKLSSADIPGCQVWVWSGNIQYFHQVQ